MTSVDIERSISDEVESDDDSTAEEPDENIPKNDLKRIHREIERQRRLQYGKHMKELSSLITNYDGSKSAKISHLNLLQMAADLLDQINLRYQYDPLLPSNLTKDEVNFLNLEASNAFLFVTTMESSIFRIIHVTDSIYRVLHLMPEQWIGQDLFSFIHPDDLFQVQNLFIPLTHQIDKKPSIKCRLNQGNGTYTSVTIDGRMKKIDQSLKPVSTNELGYYAFIGICHVPLKNQYNEKNMCLYKDSQSLIFSCRCSPNDWKIFLVDGSITTFPSISFNTFRNKSVLDFIHIDDQPHVHRALLNATLTLKGELIICHLIYSPNEILTMILDIKPFFNPSSQRIDFIELTFKNITDLMENSIKN